MPTLSKKSLSLFLRIGCERQFILSLYSKKAERLDADMPVVEPNRAGLGLVSKAGFTYQEQKVSELANTFGSANVRVNVANKNGQPAPLDLRTEIGTLRPYQFLVEASYDANTTQFRQALRLLDLCDHAGRPLEISKAQPDMLQALPPLRDMPVPEADARRDTTRFGVEPDGALMPLSDTDTRLRLRIIDVKLASEPGAHYFAEVVYYAMTLSAWLREHNLDQQFVVIAAPAVWPGNYDTSVLSRQLADWRKQVYDPSAAELSRALEADLEIGDVEVFAPRLRKLLSDTLPTLLQKDWRVLDWHVDYRCKGCELLGYPNPKRVGDDNEVAGDGTRSQTDVDSRDLCWPTAEREKHLSRVVGLTRGATAQLRAQHIPDVPRLAHEPVASSVFDTHQGLRAKRNAFPHRATALENTAASAIPDSGGDALMPRWPNLHVHVFVDYDLSTAITAAIGVRAFWVEPLPFGSPFKGASHKANWPDKGLPDVFLVDTNNLGRERQEFLKFLRHLHDIFDMVIQADVQDVQGGRRDTKTTRSSYQIYLWDQAQRKHLVRLMGRYLADVLGDKDLRDLAWLFPPPELLQKAEEATRRSPFTIVADVINNTLAVPIPHHYRLIDVARQYAAPLIHTTPVLGKNGLPLEPYFLFDLYQEPMSDLTPSERIHEWWARSGRWSETQDRIKQASQTKVRALGDIVGCLEKTLGDKLVRQAAPPLGRSPQAVSRLAPPSRLLLEFTRLNVALDELETDRVRAMPPYERAARSKSARLELRLEGSARDAALKSLAAGADGPLANPAELYVYALKPDSFEINARPGDFGYALSPESRFGFLDQNAAWVLKGTRLDNQNKAHLQQTVAEAKLTAMTIEAIDRVNGIIALCPDRDAVSALPALEDAGTSFAQDVILDPIHEDFLKSKLTLTLQGIGNPPIAASATPSNQVLASPPIKARKADDSEAAQLLWNAPAVHAQSVWRDLPSLRSQLETHLTTLGSGLDASQWEAWHAALSKRLTLIWGPPGTGKSHTLRAILMGALQDASAQGRPLRLLVTANTYTAIDNVLLKLGRDLGKIGTTLSANLYRVQSKWRRESPDFAQQNPTVANISLNVRSPGSEVADLVTELNQPKSLSVIGCAPQQLHNLAVAGLTRKREPEDTLKHWFDLIILDEASQMDVATSTLVMTKLAPAGSLVLAGDDLQLPPIHSAEPPEGLEYEVGSIYNYFRRRHDIEPSMLDVNYRSNSTIVALTKTAGYNPKLHSASPQLALDLMQPLPTARPSDWPAGLFWTPEWCRLLDPAQPVTCFVYDDKLSGQVNEFEASAVSAVAWLLRKSASHQLANENGPLGKLLPCVSMPYSVEQFWDAGLGVVTPHRAQMAKVVQQLQSLFPPTEGRNIRQAVDTVERFQGQERDVIVGSFGIGDPDVIAAEDEFLYSLRRFNVLISRPRAKLILFVTNSLLDHLSNDKEILEESRLLKLAVDGFCSNRSLIHLGYIQNGSIRDVSGWLHSA